MLAALVVFSSWAGGCYETPVRPRFVVALCAAGVILAAIGMWSAIAGETPAHGPTAQLGLLRFGGDAGRVLRAAESIALCAGAWGLWTLRPWARLAAMGYLAAVILSYLFLGVGAGRDRAAWTLVWQVSIVPFATFCYMFLHNGRRYFAAANDSVRTR